MAYVPYTTFKHGYMVRVTLARGAQDDTGEGSPMSLRKTTIVKIAGLMTSGAVVLGLAAAGSGMTGAYFSDTAAGNVTGTVGSIKVSLSGGNGADAHQFTFDRLLPGTPQSIQGSFTNTGNSNEDVYLTFPNATALSALNNLGTYGEVHVDDATGTEIFASSNLTDHYPSGTPGLPGVPTLISLPSQLEVAKNIGPGASGSFTFTFGYAGKLSTTNGTDHNGGGVWNAYPASGQKTVNSADGTGSGLPIAIVATQVGQTP